MTFLEIVHAIQKELGDTIFSEVAENIKQPFVEVAPKELLNVCKVLHTNEQLYFDYLACISGIDNGVESGTLSIVYHFNSLVFEHSFVLKVTIPREIEGEKYPSVPSIESIWKAANWHEREAFDLFGIRFENHPDLRRILLPANWKGHPLRKDYEEQEYYNGIKVIY